jgi:hypothetical protein
MRGRRNLYGGSAAIDRQNRAVDETGAVGWFYPIARETSMRIAVLAILTLATVSAAAPARAQTYNPDYPVCLEVYGRFPYIECAYTSLQQCRWSASGQAAMCIINPYPAGSYAPAKRVRGQRRVY